MAKITKLGRKTDQRKALLRNQASYLLWHGKITTTQAKAKAVQSYVEKIITLAVNTYDDTIKVTKNTVNEKGEKVEREVINDGVNKLNARRRIASKVYKLSEDQQKGETKKQFKDRTRSIKDPLIEKIFNIYGPKYSERKEEKGNGGGYTRIIKLETRKGDNAPMALIELV